MYHEIAQQTALKSPWATLSLSCIKQRGEERERPHNTKAQFFF
jgi:hypothetical protein